MEGGVKCRPTSAGLVLSLRPADNEQKYYQPQCNGELISCSSSACSVVVSNEQMNVDEDSSAADAEVSNFTSETVNLRNKHGDDPRIPMERPMSWEGELSDSEVATIKPEPEDVADTIDNQNSGKGNETKGDDEGPQPLKLNNETINEKVLDQSRTNHINAQTELPLLVDKILSSGSYLKGAGPTPSPDSAVYSCYSPTASPVTSRHILSSSSGISSPFTPSLSRNNSDASQYGGSQHSSCYSHSYSSVSVSPTQFSPTHSPIQGRHIPRPGFPSPVLNSRSVHDYSIQDYSCRARNMAHFRPPTPMDVNGNISDSWAVFKVKFLLFQKATGNSKLDIETQVAQFFYIIGIKAFQLINTFDIDTDGMESIDELVEILDKYFMFRDYKLYHECKFFLRNQQPSEKFDKYLDDLKVLCNRCEFKEEDRLLRSRIVLGVYDKDVKDKLLQDMEEDIGKIINYCREVEYRKELLINNVQAMHIDDLQVTSAELNSNDEHEYEGGILEDKFSSLTADMVQHSAGLASPGISRQQLINSPCPICGDKISGFHYGIFSCESCKGFFKRTVQNRKNYVCLRGSSCPVTISTRKKCPACRFDKCLNMGMKLEAIREDRTRGGRSTYQCSYTVPAGLMDQKCSELRQEHAQPTTLIPPLLQEIMEVEHLWQYNEGEARGGGRVGPQTGGGGNSTDLMANLCNIADHRLYKIVKWCKSLPLFKNISIDDQTSLLINAWCELLLFSCCFRSMSSPGEIRVSLGKCISLPEARTLGLGPPIERMLNFTEHLRRLRVDRYEYVAMKVIVLLSSDTGDLREPEKVRASQEKALQALQHYTLAHYPDIPSKFGELLLRIPDLQRTCQVGKEMLSIKSKEGEGPSFNLLMELLRGDH